MRLLVVAPDAHWIEALQIGLAPLEVEVVGVRGTRSVEQSVAALGSDSEKPFAGVLVSALAAPGQNLSDAFLETADLLGALREADDSVPILVWSPYPSERLASIARRFEPTVMLPNDDPATLKASLQAASPATGKPPRAATIELLIGTGNIRAEIALDGKPVGTPLTRDWTGRHKLIRLEEQFLTWPLLQRDGANKPARYTDGWLSVLKAAGEDISEETAYSGEAMSKAIDICLDKVKELDLIHFRFNLLSAGDDTPNPFVHVPFELFYDAIKDNFVRSLAPVARRICSSSGTRTRTAVPSIKPMTGHVLFVKSDAHGAYEFTSRGKQMKSLAKLTALEVEFEAVKKARIDANRASPEKLALTADGKAFESLQNRLAAAASTETPAVQIIHYAGHSLQTSDGTTYLILPGAEAGKLAPLPMSEFAAWAGKAGAQLVILSSCESSVPEAVFRLSQSGIPAVIGFRWEVNDKEAAFFTGQVHKALAGEVPLARAFRAAVSAVRGMYGDSPTFASPMLVVQDDEWTH